MRVWMALSFSALLVSACEEVQTATDEVARKRARAAIDEVMVTQFPSIDGKTVTPYTDCIINSAKGREIARFAQAALVGADQSTVQLVLDISQRPEASACLARAALTGLPS